MRNSKPELLHRTLIHYIATNLFRMASGWKKKSKKVFRGCSGSDLFLVLHTPLVSYIYHSHSIRSEIHHSPWIFILDTAAGPIDFKRQNTNIKHTGIA